MNLWNFNLVICYSSKNTQLHNSESKGCPLNNMALDSIKILLFNSTLFLRRKEKKEWRFDTIILQKGRKAFTFQCSASPSFFWKEKVKRIKNQYLWDCTAAELLAESRNSTQKAYKRLLDWVKFIKKTYSDFHFLGFQIIP